MMRELLYFGSQDGTHFTGGLVLNAGAFETLTPEAAIRAAGTCRGIIRTLAIWSSEQLAWEINLFGDHLGPNPDPNQDNWLGYWQFDAAGGLQITGTTLYRYFISGLEIPYLNSETELVHRGKMYVMLVNRSAGAKLTYGAGSHFRFRAGLELSWG